jgi:hypothetical protein
MRADERIDTVIAAARAAPTAPAGAHRGGRPLELTDAQLLEVIGGMVADGTLQGTGRRVRVAGHRPGLEPEMRERVETLLAGMREAGFEPPRVDGPAARLGIPAPLIGQLRDVGDLVVVAPGIDYARETWIALQARLDALSESGPMSPARVRAALRLGRRHADAVLTAWRAERDRVRSRRPRG